MKQLPLVRALSTVTAASLLSAAALLSAPTSAWAQDRLAPDVQAQAISHSPTRPTALRGVWVLDMMTVKSPYGSQQTVDGAARNFQAMVADGIHGISGDIFLRPEYMQAAFQAADGMTNFKISPQMDMSVLFHRKDDPQDMENRMVTGIEGYCKEAASHKSAAVTKTGRYIVWMYGIKQLSTDQWQQMKQKVAQDGYKVYYVGQVDPRGGADLWDEYYSFFPSPPVPGKIATIMPQYTRPNQKNYLAPESDKRLRQQWDQAKAAGASSVFVVTWNGFKDGSDIAGHSDLEAATKDEGAQFGSQATPVGTDDGAGG